jgi:uncharacterized sulfatase
MSKPNIIFLFTDQQRWDTLACAGYNLMITPNLDKLAEGGVPFDWTHPPDPLCTPARTSSYQGALGVSAGSTGRPTL